MVSGSTHRGHDNDRFGIPGLGTTLEGRYELLRMIGKGGMGMVVEGRHLRLERKVAIKLMHPHLATDSRFVKRFQREIRIAKDLTHPNTVRIYDFGITSSEIMYLVMEYLEGQELKTEIAQGPMSVGRTLELGRQMVDGLAEAHAMDVIHRDLKPSNIFISRTRRDQEMVKLLDFGVAKSIADTGDVITQTGNVMGTARYMAPEIYLDNAASKTADIYACGLILLEMLFGRPVFDEPTVGRMLTRHIRTPIVMPESLSERPLAKVIRRAVEKNPDLRYGDAEEMFEAMDALGDDGLSDLVIPPAEIDVALDMMDQTFQENAGNLIEEASHPSPVEPYTVQLPGRSDILEIRNDFDAENTQIIPVENEGPSANERTMTATLKDAAMATARDHTAIIPRNPPMEKGSDELSQSSRADRTEPMAVDITPDSNANDSASHSDATSDGGSGADDEDGSEEPFVLEELAEDVVVLEEVIEEPGGGEEPTSVDSVGAEFDVVRKRRWHGFYLAVIAGVVVLLGCAGLGILGLVGVLTTGADDDRGAPTAGGEAESELGDEDDEAVAAMDESSTDEEAEPSSQENDDEQKERQEDEDSTGDDSSEEQETTDSADGDTPAGEPAPSGR